MDDFYIEQRKAAEFALKRTEESRKQQKKTMLLLRDLEFRLSDLAIADKAMFASTRDYAAHRKAKEIIVSCGGAEFVQDVMQETKKIAEDGLNEVWDALDEEEDEEAVNAFMSAPLFGKTFDERQDRYAARLIHDAAMLAAAGLFLSKTKKGAMEAVQPFFDNPYAAGSPVYEARGKGLDLHLPKKAGTARAGTISAAANVADTIAIGWERMRYAVQKARGAVGYFVFRGSSYPCSDCDDETGWLHPMDGEAAIPVHNNCCCYAVYVR